MPTIMTDILTTEETAERLGVTPYYIRRLCRERGDVFGAVKYGPAWVIPADRIDDIPVRGKGRPSKK